MKSKPESENKKSNNRDRSIPQLEELNPSSIIKIFDFIKELIEQRNLSLEFFSTRNDLFNNGELYFLNYYIQQYLDPLNTKSYLWKWIEEQSKYIVTPEQFEQFDVFLEEIESNSKIIYKKVFNENKSGSLLSKYRGYSSTVDNVYTGKIQIPINYKVLLFILPDQYYDEEKKKTLYRNPKKLLEFKNFFINTLKGTLIKSDAVLFFNNSFSFHGYYKIEPLFLNLKIVDKALFENAMFIIYNEYKNVLFEFIKDQKSVNVKQNFSKLKCATKKDFVKIIFNAFPQVRNDFYTKNISLEDFISTQKTNIRNKR